MEYQLSPQDYQKLRALQKNTKLSRRRYRKVTVLVMLHQGHGIEVAQAALGLDDKTVRRYWEGYKTKVLRLI